MRILQMLPEQIMHNWEAIKSCVQQALPIISTPGAEALLFVQESLLVGSMQCWALVADDTTELMYAVMTTKFVTDEFSGKRSLFIYTLTTLNAHPHSIWSEGYKALSAYAKAMDCTAIIAYSSDPRVLEIIESLGGDTRTRFLQLQLAP